MSFPIPLSGPVLSHAARMLVVAVWIFGGEATARQRCPDAMFPDVTVDGPATCRPLLTRRGFDAQRFEAALPDTVVQVGPGQCTESGLRNALRGLRSMGGGTVDVSACTRIDLTRPLELPGAVRLTGGDAAVRPTLRKVGTEPTSLISLRRVEHVVVQHLSLDGGGVSNLVVEAQYASNVLLEQVELANGVFNGVNFAYSGHFTVRYSDVRDNGFNGITSKECYTDYGPGLSDCEAYLLERAGGDFAPGRPFSGSFALYGNRGTGNGDYCIAMHGRLGEVAGNRCDGNRRGMKFPDAQAVVVHRNRIEANDEWGVHVYAPIEGLDVFGVVVAENRIERNGGFPARVYGAEVALLGNQIRNNACLGRCPSEPGVDAVINGVQSYESGQRVPARTEICTGSDEYEILLAGSFGPVEPQLNTTSTPASCTESVSARAVIPRFDVHVSGSALDVTWVAAESAGSFVIEHAYESEPFRQVAVVAGLEEGLRDFRYRIVTSDPGRHRVRLGVEGESGMVRRVREVYRTWPGSDPFSAAFPAPASRIASVDYRLDPGTFEPTTAELFDSSGRLVGAFRMDSPVGRLTIGVEDLPVGIYWLRFRLKERVLSRSIVVLR